MIWDSSYWKKDLLKDCAILNRWSLKGTSNKRNILFEKKIFIAAYSLRKLIEAEKICKDFPYWNISVSTFNKIENSGTINILNWHRIEEFYDFSKIFKCTITIDRLADLIIHSYIFALVEDQAEKVLSFFITSDHTKNTALYRIELSRFTDLLCKVGCSDIIETCRMADESSSSGFKTRRRYTIIQNGTCSVQPPLKGLEGVRSLLREFLSFTN